MMATNPTVLQTSLQNNPSLATSRKPPPDPALTKTAAMITTRTALARPLPKKRPRTLSAVHYSRPDNFCILGIQKNNNRIQNVTGKYISTIPFQHLVDENNRLISKKKDLFSLPFFFSRIPSA